MFSLSYLSNLKVITETIKIKKMVKQVIGETFEKLGQTIGQTAQQVVQEPGKMAETAAQQVGVKPGSKTSQPGETPMQLAQKAQGEQKRQRTITALQAEIRDIQLQKTQELPKQITGKPGFSEKRVIRQLKVSKEKNLPPAVAQAKRKGGTMERKLMGGSG